MPEVTPLSSRKSDHIRINLEEDVASGQKTGLERYRFDNRAVPELNLKDVDTSLTLFGRSLRLPLLISSMTGGTERAAEINRNLALAAGRCGVAMGVGSQRAAIERPETASSFQVRRYAADILLFANLGAVQLNYGYGVAECRRAVEMIEADALILHFNALQEAVQPEGDTCFAELAGKLEQICRALSVPVVAKEVGWGFSEADVRLLRDAGVAAIDASGAGGTSWTQVEMHRAQTEAQKRLAAAFINWGIPTSEAILNIRRAAPELLVFASGGLRSGVDIAKCISLGAKLGGLAGPFLKAATRSDDEVSNLIAELGLEIKICMFAAGATDLHHLSQTKLIRISD